MDSFSLKMYNSGFCIIQKSIIQISPVFYFQFVWKNENAILRENKYSKTSSSLKWCSVPCSWKNICSSDGHTSLATLVGCTLLHAIHMLGKRGAGVCVVLEVNGLSIENSFAAQFKFWNHFRWNLLLCVG